MARKLCIICNIRKGTSANGKDFSNQCDPCHQEAGWENTHSDSNHDAILAVREQQGTDGLTAKDEEEIDGCWICFPELNRAKAPAKAVAAKKVQGFRRTQLNHKEMCTHAQTPKARRTCKNAFWAGVQVMVTEGKLTEDQAWEHCIKHLTTNQAANADLQAIESPATVAADNAAIEAAYVADGGAPAWTVAPRGPKGGVINQLKATKPKKN